MNDPETFENRLARQPLRNVPAAWRDEILSAAEAARPRVAARPTAEREADWAVGWRLRFARFPLAWASLAALWIALIGINLMLPGPFARLPSTGLPSAHLSTLAALEVTLSDSPSPTTELCPPAKTAPALIPPDAPVRPRSERRREINLGALCGWLPFNLFT